MNEADVLILACVLGGNGAGCEIGWPEIRCWRPGDGTLWIQLNRADPDANLWLRGPSGVAVVPSSEMDLS